MGVDVGKVLPLTSSLLLSCRLSSSMFRSSAVITRQNYATPYFQSLSPDRSSASRLQMFSSTRGSKIINNSASLSLSQSFMNHSSLHPCSTLFFAVFLHFFFPFERDCCTKTVCISISRRLGKLNICLLWCVCVCSCVLFMYAVHV